MKKSSTNESGPAPYDVIVIGCGPVGLATAHLLGMKGVRVAAVDPNRIVCQHPRATHLDDESMRTLQTLGAADMEGNFLRQEGWVLRGPDDTPFLTLALPETESDQGWRTDYQFHQPDFESRLRGLLADNPMVDLWFGWEVTSLTQNANSVSAHLKERGTQATQALQGSYTVGSDGAGSFVRRTMNPQVEDLQGTQKSLIIDVHPFEHPESLSKTTGFIECAAIPVTYVPIFPPMLRFEFMLGAEDDPHELERPASVYRLLSKWLSPGSYRIMRTDTYEWHARLVHGWKQGRILLAGDAAHEMPPMLGQGMCSGLRDAMNLAWKLAAVVNGSSPESILDTYESERAPAVLPYILESARQSNLIEAIAKGTDMPSPGEPQVIERYRPQLGPGLVGSPTDPISQLTPQPRGTDNSRLDDATGYNFSIVAPEAIIAGVNDDIKAIWHRLGIVVLTETGHCFDEWLGAHGASAAVIRPDRYAYALARDADELAEATLELENRLMARETVA